MKEDKNIENGTKTVEVEVEQVAENSPVSDKLLKICRAINLYTQREITVIDVSQKTVIADQFVITTGASTMQVRSLAENVMEQLEKDEIYPIHEEGVDDGRWAVLDFGEVIVHIFMDETRLIYCLEDLWADGKNTKVYTEEGLKIK